MKKWLIATLIFILTALLLFISLPSSEVNKVKPNTSTDLMKENKLNGKITGNLIADKCGPLQDERDKVTPCIKEGIGLLVEKVGFKETEIMLEEAVQRYPKINLSCHPFSHYIGAGAFKELKNVEKAITENTSLCAWGYMHGLYVAASKELKDEELFNELLAGCKKIEELKGNPYECAHGMGDGFLQGNGQNIDIAISWCNKIEDDIWHQICSEGAYNNYVDYRMVVDLFQNKGTPNNLEARALNGEPYALCMHLTNRLDRWGCLDYSSHLTSVYPDGLSYIIKACDKLIGDFNSGCYKGLGREWAFDFKNTTDSDGVKKCENAKEAKGAEQCIIAFIFSRTQVGLDHEGKIFNSLCTQPKNLNVGVKAGCREVGMMLKDYFKGKWKI